MKVNLPRNVLALAIVFALKWMPASADTWTDEQGIVWTYTVMDGVASIGGGSYFSPAISRATTGDIVIPDVLGGFPVTAIDECAFQNCASIKSVVIPDSVTAIKRSAFANCASLRVLKFGNGITTINYGLGSQTVFASESYTIFNNPFEGCSALVGIEFGSRTMSVLNLDNFSSATHLVYVYFPGSLPTNVYGTMPGVNWRTCYVTHEAYPEALPFQLAGAVYMRYLEGKFPTEEECWDLDFYRLDGWPASFFLSKEKDSYVSCARFLEGEPIYSSVTFIDWWGIYDIPRDVTNTVYLSGSGRSNAFTLTLPQGWEAGKYAKSAFKEFLNSLQLAPGEYTVTWVLNEQRTIPETNYANNTNTLTFTVVPSTEVTFVSEGNIIATRRYGAGDAYETFPSSPIRSGFRFVGWFTEEEGGDAVTVTTSVPKSPITLYAHWRVDAQWDLVFHKLSGWPAPIFLTDKTNSFEVCTHFVAGNPIYFTGAFWDDLHNVAIMQNISNTLHVVGAGVEKSSIVWKDGLDINWYGYVVSRLYDCLQDLPPGEYTSTFVLNEPHCIYETNYANNTNTIAFTVAPSTAVTFLSDGNVCTVQYYEKGGLFKTLPDAPFYYGYEFLGWFTEEEGGDVVSVTTHVPDSPTTLYAHWKTAVKQTLTVGGTLSSGVTRWIAGNLYKVTSDIVIPSGATLEIEPGVVVKFAAGRSLVVNAGGELAAMGRRTLPIVFTSLKDDANGGDTNGDGASTGKAGDWDRILVRGVATMDYCSLLYGSRGGSTDDILTVNGGTVRFSNGKMMNIGKYAVGLESGYFYMNNSVIAEAYCAFRHWPADPIVNSVIYNCNRLSNNDGQKLYNCIIVGVNEAWDWSSGRGNTYRNCLFWNELDFGLQKLPGSALTANGNIWADPLFVNPENGDFRIAANSPCVDAGDGSVAPGKDYYGSPRMNVNGVRPTGSVAANGAVPDIGIYEVPGDGNIPSADLTVTAVTAPESFEVGGEVEVSWTVRNVGEETASGIWRDEIELVAANGQAFSMGTVTTQAEIRPGASANFRAIVVVPAAPEGAVQVRVTVNKYQDLFEAMKSENNVYNAVSTLNVPTLAVPTDGGFIETALPGDSDIGFALDGGNALAAHGGVLVIRGVGELDAWLGNGSIAAKDNAIRSAVKISEDTWLLQVPKGSEPRVTIRNDGEGDVATQLSLEVGGFFLLDTGKKSAANSGVVSVPFFGNGFGDSLVCWLERGGKRVEAGDLKVESGVSALATFDVMGCEAGDWTLHVKKGEDEASAVLLSLTQSRIGAKWWCKVNVASSLRSGRVYVGSIEYGNSGDTAMPAPYLHVTANEGTLIRLNEADAWSDSTELLAISETYPASSLKAGESCKVEFFYKTTGSRARVKCDYTLSDAKAFPWDTNSQYMRPSWATDEMWSIALATLKSNIGNSWNGFLERMRANADHLMKIGRTKARLDRMWQMEINEALGVDFAVQTLAGGVDLVRNGHGFAISFSRTYGSSMSSRLRNGVLGYGWRDNCSTYAELVDSNTLVIHASSGLSYQFTKASGSWVSEEARDRVTVKETGSEYVFTYGNGIVQRISKSNMRASSIRDARGNMINFTYSGTQLQKVEHSDGGVLTFTYSGDKIAAIADDRGRNVTYGYTGDLLTSVTAFNGLVTRYVYHAADSSPLSRALTQIVYPDGTTKDYTYDDWGRVATISVNGNQFTTEIVRGLSGSYSIVAPNGGVTEVTVGAKGNVPQIVNALGQVVKQKYTDNGLLESVIAPSGKRNKMNYNTDGQLVSAVSASGAETSFAYESDFDNLASVTDAKGHAISYGYDDKGRGNSISYVDGSMSSLEYNEKGDVVRATNRRGETIEYEYDAEGNLTKKTWPNGRTFTFAYDAKGNVTNAADSVTGAVTMEYDLSERLTRIVYPKGRGFTYTYDAVGRVTERAMLGGSPSSATAIQRYTYDSLGRLSRVTDGNNNPYLTNAYDPTTGWLVTQTYGNGTVVSNAYDILGRTVGIYHSRTGGSPVQNGNAPAARSTIAFFEYTYDADGKCTSQTTAEGTETYTYDADGQLTAVTYPDGTSESFTYDAVGNRISRTGSLPVQNETYTVNALNQYTEIVNAQAARSTMEYDLDGNMTRKGDTRYTYDTLNRLVAVTNDAENIRWSCEYDVFGNRVSVTDNGTTTERLFVQGALPSVAAEYNGDTLSKSHILVGAVRLADISRTGGSPVQARYYHADMLGSARLLTDGSGATKGTRSFKAFGETRTSTGEATDAGYVGTLGVETDSNGLLFMRNRYYDASMGRFIQMDPIGLDAGDVNVYRYCGNNVISGIDILGLERQTCSRQGLPRCRIIGRMSPPNGCGAEGGLKFPDGSPVNEWLCALHDVAYATQGIPKWVADKMLINEAGSLYGIAVTILGGSAWNDAQDRSTAKLECSDGAPPTECDMYNAVLDYARSHFGYLEPKGVDGRWDFGARFWSNGRGVGGMVGPVYHF